MAAVGSCFLRLHATSYNSSISRSWRPHLQVTSHLPSSSSLLPSAVSSTAQVGAPSFKPIKDSLGWDSGSLLTSPAMAKPALSPTAAPAFLKLLIPAPSTRPCAHPGGLCTSSSHYPKGPPHLPLHPHWLAPCTHPQCHHLRDALSKLGSPLSPFSLSLPPFPNT